MVLYPTHIISKTLFTIQANVEIHSDNVVLERRRRAGRKPKLKRERTIFQFIVWIKGEWPVSQAHRTLPKGKVIHWRWLKFGVSQRTQRVIHNKEHYLWMWSAPGCMVSIKQNLKVFVYVYNKDKRTEPFVTDKQSIIIDAAVVHVYCCRLAWEQQNHDNNFHKGKYTLFTKKQHRQCFDICKLWCIKQQTIARVCCASGSCSEEYASLTLSLWPIQYMGLGRSLTDWSFFFIITLPNVINISV